MAASAESRWRAQALGPRVASTLLLAPVALVAVWFGGRSLAALLGVLLLLALWEFFAMARRAGVPVLTLPGLVAAAALLVLATLHQSQNVGVILFVSAVWTVGQSLVPPPDDRVPGLAFTWLGIGYVVGLGAHVMWLRELPRGGELLLLVVAATWAADIFAFLVGVRWGRHRIVPHVSPGKTAEGLAGGLVGAAAVGAGLAAGLLPDLITPVEGLFVGALIGVTAPLGDLLESLVKRHFGAKDSGDMIPGHGGVLDRIDSLLLTAPLGYYLLRFLLEGA